MSITQLIWLFITLGGITGFMAVAAVMFLFGISIQDTAKHGMKLLIIGAVTGISAFVIGNRFITGSRMSQASPSYKISNWQTAETEQGITKIEFTTDTPVKAYLEYQDKNGDTLPIFSSSGSGKSKEHVFILPAPLRAEGTMWVVVEGQKISHPLK